MTNADRIRSMSDEELVDFLGIFMTEAFGNRRSECLKWLKEEVAVQNEVNK